AGRQGSASRRCWRTRASRPRGCRSLLAPESRRSRRSRSRPWSSSCDRSCISSSRCRGLRRMRSGERWAWQRDEETTVFSSPRRAWAAEERARRWLVDAAHWLDDASADALVFVARRLEAEGIVLLFAAREGETGGFDAPEPAQRQCRWARA